MADSTSAVTEHRDFRAEAGAMSAEATASEPPGAAGGTAAADLAAWELAPLEDGFIRRFVGTLLHIRRYAKFYLVGFGWLVVMALVQPFDARGGQSTDAALGLAGSTGTRPAASSGVVDGDSAAVPQSGAVDDFAYTPYEVAALDDLVTETAPAPVTPAASTAPSTVPTVLAAPQVVPLRIDAAGYAAVGAGTPADSTPEGGLPVAVAAGAESKRSFVKLAGSESVLRLTLADAEHRFPEAARVMACPITGEWTAERGMAMSDSPTFDCTGGVLADVDGSVFSFDLSPVAEDLDGMSFALVAYVVSDPAITFEVTFADTALTDAG